MKTCDANLKQLIADLRLQSSSPFRMFAMHYSLTLFPAFLGLGLLSVFPHNWGIWILVAIANGFVQNGLGLLMHEGSHFFFHTNLKVNDWLSNALVCFPILNTVQGYRWQHVDHHRSVNTTADPYQQLYTYPCRSSLLLTLLGDLFLLTAFFKFLDRYVRRDTSSEAIAPSAASSRSKPSMTLATALGLLVTQLLIWGMFYLITGQIYAYILLWILPLTIIPQVINRIRTVVEHCSESGQLEVVNRSTDPNFWEYLLIAPYGYSFHWLHHQSPSIPYYQLRQAHCTLLQQGVIFERDELSQGYCRTFLSILKTLPRTPSRTP